MASHKKTRHASGSSSKHRSTGRRLSHEQQQEYVSLDQCAARLSAYGWIRNELKRDHGEDVLIHIYADGNSTGLTFLLQAKSTTNLASLVQKRDPGTVSYTFEVADLKHWIVSASPVVAVVWDVQKQEGIWVLISDAIRDLDARSPGWRRLRSTAVHIPVDNKTDDRGLARLRHAVADHYFPIFSRQYKEFAFTPTFFFPKTEDGQSALAAFQNFLDTGEAVTLDGTFVKQIKMPDWWERLYGPHAEVQSFVMGPSRSHLSIACRLEVETDRFSVPVAVPYVDLKLVRGGRKEVTLSNEHQPIPVHVQIRVRRPEGKSAAPCNFSFTIDHAPTNIYDARDASAFALSMHSARRIRLIGCSTGKAMLDAPFSGLNEAAQSREVLEWWYDLLEKLCFLQSRITRFGTVKLAKGWLRGKDEVAIRRLYAICTTGEERTTMSSLSFSVQPACLPRDLMRNAIAGLERDPSDENYCFKVSLPARESVRIVSVTIPLGRIEVTLLDSIPVLKQLLAAADSKKETVTVRCKGVRAVRRYVDWLSGGQYAQSSGNLTTFAPLLSTNSGDKS